MGTGCEIDPRVVCNDRVQDIGCDILQLAKGYWLMYVLVKWSIAC